MAGRNSSNDSGSGREQARKVRGFARGHGAHHHHKRGKEAPRSIGSGRDRTQEDTRRQGDFTRMHDDVIHDLENSQRHSSLERSIEELGDTHQFGTALQGEHSRGRVIEVRKGNFLTRMTEDSHAQWSDGSDADTERTDAQTPRPAMWKAGDLLRTSARGTMQQFDLGLSSLVAPGDEIEVVVPPLSGPRALYHTALHAILAKVHPRKNEFRRVHPSGRAIQTLATNIDRIYIITSAGQPEFRPGFVDRVLVCAASSGIDVSLVVNKMDLGLPERDEELLKVYRSLGIPVYKISVHNMLQPEGDFAALKAALTGRRSVVTGHSGVGKSSLVLALNPKLDPNVVRTGEVSGQTEKGKHTTTHARLFTLFEGSETKEGEEGEAKEKGEESRPTEIVDTPGVREFTPADTDRKNLWGWFPEIVKFQSGCSYADCSHTVEKSCAVLAAVERGEMHPRRHQSYVRMYETLPT